MKSWARILGIILVLSLLAGMVTACGKNKKDEPEEEDAMVDPADIDDASFVNLESGFTSVKVVDGESAIQAVESAYGDLGLDDDAIGFNVIDISKFDGETYYRMQECYNDTPIFGREVVLIADKRGNAISLSSNAATVEDGTDGDLQDVSSINYDELLHDLEDYLNENSDLEYLDFKCTTLPETVYYSEDGSSLRPCFTDVVSLQDENGRHYEIEVILDCNSYDIVAADLVRTYGSVTASGSDRDGVTREFNAYKQDGTYYMYDSKSNITVYNANDNNVGIVNAIYDGNDNLYYYSNGKLYDINDNRVYLSDDETEILDESGNVIGRDLLHGVYTFTYPDDNALEISNSSSKTWDDPDAVTAMYRVESAYNFYYEYLGRRGYNDKNGEIRVFYNDEMDGDSSNAYSYDRPDSTVLSFGTYNSINQDTVGHEFTHSVIGSIVDLPYRNQSGAINEGYADIFGEFVEDFADGGLDNSCDWLHGSRNLIDPLSNGNPEKFRGKNWAINLSVPEWLYNTPLVVINQYTDNGGVHTNSTVLSHAAYLMNIGIDGNEEMKIDTSLLAKIWYKSMFSLHSNETFKQCAKHVYEAAERTDGVTEAQLECIRQAFDMAGLKV